MRWSSALTPNIVASAAAKTPAAARRPAPSAMATSTAPRTRETKKAYWWETPRRRGRSSTSMQPLACPLELLLNLAIRRGLRRKLVERLLQELLGLFALALLEMQQAEVRDHLALLLLVADRLEHSH